jgi:hypothetical protein
MVLLNPIVQISIGPVFDAVVQFRANCASNNVPISV